MRRYLVLKRSALEGRGGAEAVLEEYALSEIFAHMGLLKVAGEVVLVPGEEVTGV